MHGCFAIDWQTSPLQSDFHCDGLHCEPSSFVLHCEPHHIPFPQPTLLEHACPSVEATVVVTAVVVVSLTVVVPVAVVAAVMVGVVDMPSVEVVLVVLVVAVVLVNILVEVFGFTERLTRRDDGQPTQLVS